MGWYLRKSFRLGPLRLNLSKSGLGVSAGVTGFRVGTGPRGSYVHAGRGGIYFRQRLSGPSERREPARVSVTPMDHDASVIRTVDANQLADASAENLLSGINRALRVPAIAPLVIGSGAIVMGVAVALCVMQHWAWVFLATAALGATIFGGFLAHARDVRLKTVHLWFDLSAEAGNRFKAFERALQIVASCDRVWRVTTQTATGDWKRNAGASSLLTRARVTIMRRLPGYVDSNVRPFSLTYGEGTLYFFPDQVLVYGRSHVGAVSYGALEIDVGYSDFRETDAVPGDAKVVGHSWQYVNRNGGPDRRFSNNPQIPVCRYERLALRSRSGLNIHLMLSRLGAGELLREAEAQMVPLKRELPADSDELAFREWIRSRERTHGSRR